MLEQARAAGAGTRLAARRPGDVRPRQSGPSTLVLVAGNTIPLLEPGTLLDACERLAAHLAPGGVVVCGFGLDAAHLPRGLPGDPAGRRRRRLRRGSGSTRSSGTATWDRDAFDPAEGYVGHRCTRRPRAMRIVVLTGAGISAESGVPTFRDADGLWEGHRVEDVATPGGLRPPALGRAARSTTRAGPRSRPSSPTPRTSRWRGSRRRSATTCSSSPRTSTTSTSAAAPPGCCTCTASCAPRCAAACGGRLPWDGPLGRLPAVPALRRDRAAPGRGVVRRDPLRDGPDPGRPRAAPTCSSPIGTSGAVYPAAGFVQYAARARRPHARAQPRAQRGHPPLRRGPPRPGLGAGARLGRRCCALTS